MELRQLHLRSLAGITRTETLEGETYVVVPVVGLVEGVIRAINSPHPELVTAEQFGRNVEEWNGRPIFINHPMENGKPVSGKLPHILRTSIGKVFNTRTEGKRLLMEAWLHTERAKTVINRVASGKPVEISTGAFVTLSPVSGEFQGRTYKGSWDTIGPDHLAILEEGLTGACSCDMGCGIRAAMYDVTGDVVTEQFRTSGGPGSGWTAENGHVPAAGKAAAAHTAAASAHMAAANAHEAAAKGGDAKAAETATKSAYSASKAASTNSYSNQAAKYYSSKGMHQSAAQYHRGAAKEHTLAASWAAPKSRNSQKGRGMKRELRGNANANANADPTMGPNAQAATAHEVAAKAHDKASSVMQSKGPGSPEYTKAAATAQTASTAAHDSTTASGDSAFSKEARGYSVTAQDAASTGLHAQAADAHREAAGYHALATENRHAVSPLRKMRAHIKELVSKLRASADPTDTTPPEEKAELVGYGALQTLLTEAANTLSQASTTVGELISENATTPEEDNDDEESMEEARLNVVEALTLSTISTLSSVVRLTQELNTCDDDTTQGAPYTMRSAEGRDILKKLHTLLKDLGADCGTLKAAQQDDCGCGGRAAGTEGEKTMNKANRIAALVASEHSPVRDPKALETATDAQLEILEAHVASTIRVAAAGLVKTETPAKEETEEEWLKRAPMSVRTLISSAKATTDAQKVVLVGKLKVAQKAYSEEELKKLELSDLQKLATLAKVDVPIVDYSGQGVRIAEEGEKKSYFDEAPPDGYRMALAKGQKEAVN